MLARIGPPLAILLLTGPIIAGLAGTLLPSLGYLPAIGGNEFTAGYFAGILSRPGIGQSCLVSLASGIVTAAVSLAVVAGFAAAFAGSRIFNRIQHAVSPLLSVPHAAAAFGLAFLIAPSGMAARLVSPALTGWMRPPDVLIVHDRLGLAMMAGLIAKEIPFLLLMTLAALPQIRARETRMLAAALGYGRMAGFVFTLWPRIYRQIRFAVFAVIVFASSVVDVATILGPTTPAPLAVRVVGWMNDPQLSMHFTAAAGAILQLGISAAALFIWLGVERICAAVCDWLSGNGIRLRHDRLAQWLAAILILAAALSIIAGLVTLAIWSFAGLWQFPDATPANLTLQNWVRTLPEIATPLATTFKVAALSTAIATALVILCMVREDETRHPAGNRALLILFIPLLVPQAAFLFGLQLLFVATGMDAMLPALVAVHLVFVLPYVFLSLSDPWRAFDRRYDAVAVGLGRGRITALWAVKLPMLLRAILTAAAVGFAVSVGQYLPTVLIGAGRLTTITTEAVALAAGGNRRVIGVYAFFQLILPFAGFLIATALPALLFRNRRAMRV